MPDPENSAGEAVRRRGKTRFQRALEQIAFETLHSSFTAGTSCASPLGRGRGAASNFAILRNWTPFIPVEDRRVHSFYKRLIFLGREQNCLSVNGP